MTKTDAILTESEMKIWLYKEKLERDPLINVPENQYTFITAICINMREYGLQIGYSVCQPQS